MACEGLQMLTYQHAEEPDTIDLTVASLDTPDAITPVTVRRAAADPER